MKKNIILLGAALMVLSCQNSHFITDSGFRKVVQKDYEERREAHSGALAPFMALPEDIGPEEKEALEFLYAYMPLADVTDYPTDFYLRNVRAALSVRDRWGVPEREFRHFVLPLRVNNEQLDSARMVFSRELLPRIKGLSMEEAILEVNHWCHEKVTYQPSDARTMAPLALTKNALGRCGEESTFCVTALRSVGIPARQVYTPRWAHTDDNHAWVEAWAGGRWHFLGACEPEAVLDLGWFNAPASRALLMHTKVFGKYDGPEEVVLGSPNYTEVNLIDNYASTARADFRILRADGTPAAGARVDFCIYNYAEFYPAVTKYADAEGRTFLSAGKGDMLVWASLDGAFGYGRCSFGKDSEVTVTLSRHSERSEESFPIIPPPENVRLPEVSPELQALNTARFAREDSLRHAYEATFRTDNPLLARTRGNWETIENFLTVNGNPERREAILSALSTKDLQDVTEEILQDYYSTPVPFLGARVEDEFLSPFYGYFREHFRQALRSPEEVVRWVRDSITVLTEPKAWNIAMSPRGVYESRVALPRSRDIFFVSLCRALGFEAQKDPVTGKIQYRKEDEWLDVHFGASSEASATPKGLLRLTFQPSRSVDNPKYYSHFTLSKIEDGRPRLLTFDEGEVDMGGGVDWEHVFKTGFPLDEGLYLLVSGNRLSDGSVPVTLRFVSIEADKTTTAPLVLEEPSGAVPVIGSLDAELHFDGGSILSAAGRGFYALAVLEPGKEPTNHTLRDLAAAREALEAWGRPILLLCPSQDALERLQKEQAEGRYGQLPSTVLFGVDGGAILQAIVVGQRLSGRLPLMVVADSFNRMFFCSEGYTIGLGEQLVNIVNRL